MQNEQQQRLQQVLQQNPQMIKQLVDELKKSNITPEQLNKIEQMAMQALNNPESYPHLHQQLIQSGDIDAGDLPEQFDQKIVASIAIAAQIGLHSMKG